MRCVRSVAFVVVGFGICGPALADELYRQNPIEQISGMSSQDARNVGGLGHFSEVSDNFTLVANSTITQVEFWGGCAVQTPPTIDGYMIRIYEDAGGAVGTMITSQDIMTFDEVGDFSNGTGTRMHTKATLNTPVALPAGQYWLSVVAILPRGGGTDLPQWGWVGAATVNPPFPRQLFFGMSLDTGNDVAFVINGTTGQACGTADFDGDGDYATDADIEAFFRCLAGSCCATCWHLGADFNADGDVATDADIEAFFRVLAGQPC